MEEQIKFLSKVDKRIEKENRERVEKWCKFDSSVRDIQNYFKDTIKLRVSEEKSYIETSKGIKLNYDACKKLYFILKKNIKREGLTLKSVDGRDWNIDRITEEGNIIAGCHRVNFEECKRIAKQEKWI